MERGVERVVETQREREREITWVTKYVAWSD
jgi:hypothetical protein